MDNIEKFRSKIYDKVFNRIMGMESIQDSPAFKKFIEKIDDEEDIEIYGLENSISLLLNLFISRLEFEQKKSEFKKDTLPTLFKKKKSAHKSKESSQQHKSFQLEDMLGLANELVIGSCKWIIEQKIYENMLHKRNFNFDEYQPLNKKEARTLTIDIIQAFSALFPPMLHRELITSLVALNFGDATPLLTPDTTGKQHPYGQLAALRIKAVEHRRFRYKLGKKENKNFRIEDAEDQVANSYNVVPETFKTWRKRAAKDEKILTEERENRAETLADFFIILCNANKIIGTPSSFLTNKTNKNDWKIGINKQRFFSIFDEFSDNALAADGSKYNELMKINPNIDL